MPMNRRIVVLNRLRELFTKHREVIVYLFFGGVTTVVNFAVYWPLVNWLHISATVSNILAWIVAVAVAYLTNKPFVFQSHDWSLSVVVPELGKFVGCRVASGVMETVFIGLTVDLLHWHALVMKIIVSVIVIVLNYVGSKWLVFAKSKQ